LSASAANSAIAFSVFAQVRGPLGVALGEVGRLLLSSSPLDFRRLPLGNELSFGDGQLLFQRIYELLRT
jgi:hypothetical protein